MVLVCISCSLSLFWMLAQGKRLKRAAGSIYGYLAERMKRLGKVRRARTGGGWACDAGREAAFVIAPQ